MSGFQFHDNKITHFYIGKCIDISPQKQFYRAIIYNHYLKDDWKLLQH